MDVADHLRPRQGEEVAVVQQILLRVLEAFPADVRFRHAVGADRGAHRTIDDGDSTLEYLFKGMLAGFHHVSPKDFERGGIGNIPHEVTGLAGTDYSVLLRCSFCLSHIRSGSMLSHYSDMASVGGAFA